MPKNMIDDMKNTTLKMFKTSMNLENNKKI